MTVQVQAPARPPAITPLVERCTDPACTHPLHAGARPALIEYVPLTQAC